jgi:hypothetical protein
MEEVREQRSRTTSEGPHFVDGHCSFSVWAPLSDDVTLHIISPFERNVQMVKVLAKALTEGFVFTGTFVKFRKRKFGASSVGLPRNTSLLLIRTTTRLEIGSVVSD